MAWYTFVEQQLKHLLISKLASGSLETNFYSICRLFQDKFDNLTGENLKGKVVVKVTTPSEGIDEIPALTGNVYSLEVPLVKGVATVQNLLIQENTAGKDGQEYLLNFHTQIPPNSSPHPIPVFTLAFLFYNGKYSSVSCSADFLLRD